MQKLIIDLENFILEIETYLKKSVAEMLHQEMPSLLEEEFALFETTGNRYIYEKPYLLKRKFLAVYGVAAIYMKKKGLQKLGEVSYQEVIAKLESILWNICEEECWAIPAHVKRLSDPDWRNTIDLNGSETGSTLAQIAKELKEDLSAECVKEVKKQVLTRVVNNFFDKPVDTCWWEHGDNNWNAVCNGNVLTAYLYTREDGEELNEAYIERICDGLTAFIDGYAEDGTCLEGLAYFMYGMGNFINLSEELYEASCGKYDLLEGDWYQFKAGEYDKRRRIVEWWTKSFFEYGKTISFADGFNQDKYRMGICCTLAQKFPNIKLPHHSLATRFWDDHTNRFMFFYRDIFSTESYLQQLKEQQGKKSEEPQICRFDILKEAQWCIGKAKNGIGMACKGGHNMEPHNHNDISNFLYVVGMDMFLDDLGAGEYTKAYFEFRGRRYTILCNRSLGHSVPLIAGQEQKGGKEYCCNDFDAYEDGNLGIVKIGAETAYPENTIHKFVRTMSFDTQNGNLEIRDFFDNQGKEIVVTQNLVTRYVPEVEGNNVLLKSEKGNCQIEICDDAGKNATVRVVEKEHIDHHAKIEKVYLIQWDITVADALESVIKISGSINA